MTTFKVIEVQQRHDRETKERYKGPSKDEAIKAYKQPQSLPFSDTRFYEGNRRRYAYELDLGGNEA